jgi:hypothetical protein
MPSREGECPVCSQWKRVSKTGLMATHSAGRKEAWPPRNCPGRGLPPVGSDIEPPITPDSPS